MTSRELLRILLEYRPTYVRIKWRNHQYYAKDIQLLLHTRHGVLIEAVESLIRTYVVPLFILFLQRLTREHPVYVHIKLPTIDEVADVCGYEYDADSSTLYLECGGEGC